MDYKIIQDPIHGSIRIPEFYLDLLQTPEMQRLYGIRQLGLTYLVYPGANHTRFEHSMGTFHVAKRLAGSLEIDGEDRKLLMAAALLHDAGHGPYSHSLEYLYREMGFDHAKVTASMITGDYDIIGPERRRFLGSRTIPEIFEKNGLKPRDVANLIESYPEKKYLGQLIHGPVDADRIDYLLRDAHYTGAVHGVIDLPRLLEIMKIHGNGIAFIRKGLATIEEMLMGRAFMYQSVYFHKTVVIAEEMLGRAVEACMEDAGDFFRMDDSDLMGFLLSQKGLASSLANRIRYRRLFKRIFILPPGKHVRPGMKYRKELESRICEKAGVPEGSIIVSTAPGDLFRKEMRESEGIRILDDGKAGPLNDYGPFIDFLKTRHVPEWSVMVACDEKHGARVAKAAGSLL